VAATGGGIRNRIVGGGKHRDSGAGHGILVACQFAWRVATQMPSMIVNLNVARFKSADLKRAIVCFDAEEVN